MSYLHHTNSPNPRCTPSIAGHPLQPMLIPFLIASFVTTFVCDLAFWQTGDPFWSTGALWLLGTGLVMAVLAVIVSLIDVLAEPRPQALNNAWWNVGGNVFAAVISLYNWCLRYSGEVAVMPTGLVLSLLAVCVLLFTGWKGMELVHRRRFDAAD